MPRKELHIFHFAIEVVKKNLKTCFINANLVRHLGETTFVFMAVCRLVHVEFQYSYTYGMYKQNSSDNYTLNNDQIFIRSLCLPKMEPIQRTNVTVIITSSPPNLSTHISCISVTTEESAT